MITNLTYVSNLYNASPGYARAREAIVTMLEANTLIQQHTLYADNYKLYHKHEMFILEVLQPKHKTSQNG